MKTLEDTLIEAGDNVPDSHACACCSAELPPFALVIVDDLVVCGNCVTDARRLEAAELEQQALAAAEPWSTPLADEIRIERNRRIERALWAVDPLTSPLSASCQQAFVAYVQALHRLTVDFDRPEDVVWPEAPSLEFA